MQNRFIQSPRLLVVCCIVMAFFITAHAQQSAFLFTPPSLLPSTPIAVNAQCMGAASFGPWPAVSSNVGATITISRFSATNPFDSTTLHNAGFSTAIDWEVADDMGHSAIFTYNVTFKDLTPPKVDSVMTPPVLVAASILQVPALGPIVVSDNCSASMNVTQSYSQTAPPAVCNGGNFTRQWTLTDEAGNIRVFQQQITVYRDSLDPQVTNFPQNAFVSCTTLPAAYQNWVSDQMAIFVADDPSGIDSYSNNAPAQLANCVTPVTVRFVAEDVCGNSVDAFATFTSSDAAGPVVQTPPSDTVTYCAEYAPLLAEWIHTHGYSSVTDNCSPPFTWRMMVNGVTRDSAAVTAILKDSLMNSICGYRQFGTRVIEAVKGYVRVDFFAADACGNESYIGQSVFVVRDTAAPVISGGMAGSDLCGGGNDNSAMQAWINNKAGMTVTDACSPVAWTHFIYQSSDGQLGTGVFGVGTFPIVSVGDCSWYVDVTFYAVDQCGHVASRQFRFQLTDNVAPVISGFVDSTTLYCPVTLPPAGLSASVSDNCSIGLTAIPTFQYRDTVCAGNYTLQVTWTATDQCNNTTTKRQYFIIKDTLAPQFTVLPSDLTVSCDSVGFLPAPVMGVDVQATDVCGALQQITWQSSSDQGSDPMQCNHYNYHITRTFTATDQCGNSKTAHQQITVRDVKAPVLALALPDTIIGCQELPVMPVIPLVTDACSPLSGPVVQTGSQMSGGTQCAQDYWLAIQWTASDVCGNSADFIRNFHIIDTIAPVLTTPVPADTTVYCASIPPPPVLSSFSATDGCDGAPVVVFSEQEIRNANVAHCDHWSNYQIERTWTARDACGNERAYQQVITVIDTVAPVLTLIDTVFIGTTPGVCGAQISVPGPLAVTDGCSAMQITAVLRDTVSITGPASSTAVCDTILMTLTAPNAAPFQSANSNAVLTVYLDSADAEGPDEYFKIFGEQGEYIGNTSPTSAQCGNGSTTFSIPMATLNNWLQDGAIQLILAPNGSGAEAINPICPGRRVRAQVNYTYLNAPVAVTLTYRLDNGPENLYPPVATELLVPGLHTLLYKATDCRGNSSTGVTMVQVNDTEAPNVLTPLGQVAYTNAASCQTNWTVYLPDITENCELGGLLSRMSALTNTRFVSNANTGPVPEPVNLTITGLIPNAFSGGILKVRHRGDNALPGAFFSILDEQNTLIGYTSQGALVDACVQFHETIIPVSAAQINAWAADGVFSLRLEANTDAVNYLDFINPCGPLNAQNFDGISAVQAILEYDYAIINYEIRDDQQALVQVGTVSGHQTNVALTAGNYSVSYEVADAAGNIGTAVMPLMVRDTIRPTALCRNRTFFVSVTGTTPYTLVPSELDNGSFDNCSGLNVTFSASQTVFTCNQAGQIIPVTLTVADTSGNTAQCVAQVRIETEQIPASSTANICEGGTAQLFCTPPGNPSDYTYQWYHGPSGYSSMLQNPVITNAQLSQEGTYLVTVKGPTGCMATGTTALQLIGLPVQPVLNVSASLLCVGQPLTLTTGAYSGTSVSYQWYRNNIDTLIATTVQPNLTLLVPPSGTHQYFVRVVDLTCASAMSAPQTVLVQTPIAATVTSGQINICEGELVVLGTSVQGSNVTYQWTGPWGASAAQYPTPIAGALNHNGTTTLVISVNGCPGAPATVQITVRDRPDSPVISGDTGFCVGETALLTAQPAAEEMLWVSPASDTTTLTGTNAFQINNVTLANAGQWKVLAQANGCISPASAPHLLEVQDYPVVVILSNAPLCQGGVLQLTADVNIPVTNYQWTGPGFSAFSQQTSDVSPETGTYQVVATTSFGCSGTANQPVLIVTPPVIESIGNNAPSCLDGISSVQLFQNTTSDHPPLSFQWTYPNGTVSTSASPVIPAANLSNNGTYTLIVKDAYGCVSPPQSTTINAQMTPSTPVLVSNDNPMCSGGAVTLQVQNTGDYQNGTPVFLWNTPQIEDLPTNQPQYSLIGVSLMNEGLYSVRVLMGECVSEVSASLFLDVKPRPNPPDVTFNSPVCEGDTLYFTSTLPPLVVPDLWEWVGPSGFAPPSIGNPFRAPAMLTHAGEYFVRITVDGCVSDQTEPLVVEVKPLPLPPIAIHEGNACYDQLDTLVLKIAPGTQTPGADYQWFNQFTQQPLAAPAASATYLLNNFSTLSPGNNAFYVVADLNGCTARSFPVSAYFDTIPGGVNAVAGNDYVACDQLTLYLPPADWPSMGTGRWSQTGGPAVVISDPNVLSPKITGATAGNTYQFAWTLSNGACRNFSSDTMQVTMVAYQPAMAGVDIDTCFAQSVQLAATQHPAAPGVWSQPLSQAQIQPPIIITDPLDPHTPVTGLPEGSSNFYYFIWTVNSLGCGVSSDTLVVRVLGTVPNAGVNRSLCTDDDCVPLNASPLLPTETGKWTTTNPEVFFLSPGTPNTEACGLTTGLNQLIWETNGGRCGNASRDTLQITYERTPVANDDVISVPFGTPLSFNVADNDILPANYAVSLSSVPQNGILNQLNILGDFRYAPSITFEGNETFVYRVCNLNCVDTTFANRCDVGTVRLNIAGSVDCELPSVITPNGDDVNDVFFVPPCFRCADCQEENELTIFNQWGDFVFHALNYQQNWNGTYNGEDLPAGTYYYVFTRLLNGQKENHSGFIILQR